MCVLVPWRVFKVEHEMYIVHPGGERMDLPLYKVADPPFNL